MTRGKSDAQSLEFNGSIINTVREPLIVLDQDLRVISANRSFYEFFQVKPEETIGQLIYDLGNKQWDIPKLRELLENILPEKSTFDDYEVEHNFATIGRRIMLLNARQIEQGWGKERIILLAVEDITERREIETGLETTRKELAVIKQSADAAHEFAESVINTVREPLITLDQDLRVVTANRAFYEFFQVKPEETVGQLIYDLGNKQWDIQLLRELLENILPDKISFNDYEVEHNFATIGQRTMLLNARQMDQALGKERIILLAIEDITERRQLENLLTESEYRYRRIFETSSDGIVLLEKGEGHIVHANQAVEQMLEYSEADYIGKKLRDIGVPLDMNDFPAIMQDLNKSGILNFVNVPVKNKSGQKIYTDIYMVDRSHLAQCNIRDVSERMRVMMELQEAQKYNLQIIASAQEGFVVYDTDLTYKVWNRFMEELTGIGADEILGKNILDTSPFPRNRKIVAAVEKALKGEASKATPFQFNIPKTGKSGWTIQSNAPLKNNKDEIIGVIETVSDISEHKKLEAQLRQAQKMEAVGTLAGGIAHDFNNILSVIMGYGAIVMNSMDAGSSTKEEMNMVLSAADKAVELTKRLLLFSRKQVAEVKFVNLNDLIQDLQKMLCRMVNESIEFQLDLAEMPLIVQADTGLIEQVLINLCVNARDAMPEGGKLTISTEVEEIADKYIAEYEFGKPGKYVLLKVADNGQGMAEDIQKKIFDPFFTTKIAGKGTGLGLSICYGIIKQHNGYIHVYSEPGKGTEFKIYLPLREEAASAAQETTTKVPVKGGQETVLVAEDEPSLRKLATRILESFGYSVISAENGEEAITKFMENRERISLLLLDMIMPKKNGKEVAEAIREVSPEMKVLFASGYTMDAIKTKDLTESGFDFIQKPYQSKNLLRKVREILDR